MVEQDPTCVHTGSAVLDIGVDIGALIIYTRPELRGREIEVSPKGRDLERIHTAVLERRMHQGATFAALFLALPEGAYTVWCDAETANEAIVSGGAVAELDWRRMVVSLPAKGGSHLHEPGTLRHIVKGSAALPPRYRNGAVNAAPMGAASLRYTSDGKVAWDQMWTDFCDLALAGGPPHRGSVLGPIPPHEALAAPEAYARVVREIERGLLLVTGLPTTPSPLPGWVGLRCIDETMAAWLEAAIGVENVHVQRQGAVLYFPAGPEFRLEVEVKNVVTVVAKTHHYWLEHVNA